MLKLYKVEPVNVKLFKDQNRDIPVDLFCSYMLVQYFSIWCYFHEFNETTQSGKSSFMSWPDVKLIPQRNNHETIITHSSVGEIICLGIWIL